MTTLPKISVVTPSYNQAAFLEQTILSVLGQMYPNLEYFVLDAGSEDGSRAILERHGGQLTRWVSEKDGGQAAAINRGFGWATGDILCWLNSDDIFLPGTLLAVAEAFQEGHGFVYGDCISFADCGSKCAINRPPAHDADRLALQDYIVQPSAFWTRGLWRQTGPLDESLHYAFDWEWFLRASRHVGFHKRDRILSAYRFHSAHKSSSGGERREKEIFQIAESFGTACARQHYQFVNAHLPELRRYERFCTRLGGRGLSGLENVARALFPPLWRIPAGCDWGSVRTCVRMLGY